MDVLENYAKFKWAVNIRIKGEVIDFIMGEFGDYNPTFQDILKEIGFDEDELTQEEIKLIQSKVGL
jgi:hypothetical protein